MTVKISSLYGKKIMSNTGRWLGEVGEVVVDLEQGSVSHLLLGKINAAEPGEVIKGLFKNSVEYKRVREVGKAILLKN